MGGGGMLQLFLATLGSSMLRGFLFTTEDTESTEEKVLFADDIRLSPFHFRLLPGWLILWG